MKHFVLLILILTSVISIYAQEKTHKDSLIASMRYADNLSKINKTDSILIKKIDSLLIEKEKLDKVILDKILFAVANIEKTPTIIEIGFETEEINGKYIMYPKEILKPYHNQYYVSFELSKRLMKIESNKFYDAILDNIVAYSYLGCEDYNNGTSRRFPYYCSPAPFNAIINNNNTLSLIQYLIYSDYLYYREYYKNDNDILSDIKLSNLDAYAYLILKNENGLILFKDYLNNIENKKVFISNNKLKNILKISSKLKNK